MLEDRHLFFPKQDLQRWELAAWKWQDFPTMCQVSSMSNQMNAYTFMLSLAKSSSLPDGNIMPVHNPEEEGKALLDLEKAWGRGIWMG